MTRLRAVILPLILIARAGLCADSDPEAINAASPAAPKDERILRVIPNYQTVNDGGAGVAPLTAKEKWNLGIRSTIDPFNVANAALAAGFSQVGNQTPRYGGGASAYAQRFGAAFADFGTQNLFSAGVLANLLHQDPRYFRKGASAGFTTRIVYSLSRLVITRQDSGAAAFNASGLFGMALGIAASNLYYPAESVRGRVMAGRVTSSLSGGVMGNLLSEFWPDVQRKVFRKRHP